MGNLKKEQVYLSLNNLSIKQRIKVWRILNKITNVKRDCDFDFLKDGIISYSSVGIRSNLRLVDGFWTVTFILYPSKKETSYKEFKKLFNPDFKFKVGDKIKKPNGYKFDGEIRSTFTNTNGEIRYVAEMENNGMLHIFNESQLKLR